MKSQLASTSQLPTRKETPMKSLISARPVLWFLFLFNAAVAVAVGVAGGLQSTAMQLGGALGTAVLGAVMSAKISTMLPASWHAAHLPPLSPAQLAQVKSAVSVGAAPVTGNTPPQVASQIIRISHATFTAGMHNAFLVAAAVALAGAVIALITRRGTGTAAAHAGI